MNRKVLLEAKNLVKEFPVISSKKKNTRVHAVSDVNLTIYEGETLALVGESGCGKSTLGRLLLRLIELTSGELLLEGEDLTAMTAKELISVRKKMQIIFQDPYASLNPRMTVEQIIGEPLLTHKIYRTKEETHERIIELIGKVGIPKEALKRYPHQFSGGQRQRIGIARAIALNPKLIICDEPVSALDVSIQSQVLNLLHDLQEEYHLTYLFISHDLSVVRHIANRVCVMFLGKICEIGDADEIFISPKHPYTKFLLEAVPRPNPELRKENRQLLTGEMPSPVSPPNGCRFHTRCPYATELCGNTEPVMRGMGNIQVACHYPLV
ncbi:dipeptide ABC transporter ATP-binding protein [Anaerocolumna sp. MB42-C2]|nr:dipeptide ABC transporter ATP-binding protein [Anaerocolumna sp. MB42-C2]WMJ90772.1 dipeptide ABC transporter ATP-binding protein [Anaerocolumna sp. MB42-C2]